MDEKDKGKITRREFIKKLGYSAAAVGVASTAPKLLKPARAAKRDYILLGHPNPATGGIASFGEGSPWVNNLVLDAINKQGGIYIEEYGKQVPVKVKILDTESNPSKAGEIASRLILHDKIDLMVSMHTPDVCNPVSAICERYKMPCVNTDCPFEAWNLGGPYQWSYLVFWTVETMSELFIDMWDQYAHRTNKVVGGLWPNDPDGVAEAEIQHRLLPARGYKIVDPGRFPFFMTDYTSFINLFRKEKVEIVTGELIPPDFHTFWRQCHRTGFIPKFSTVGKACMFPSVMEALGVNLSHGITCEVWWTPQWPFKSKLTGHSAKDLCDAWTKQTGKQPTMPVGFTHVGFDVAVDVIKRAKTLDREKLRKSIKMTDMEGVVGHIKFNEQNYCPTPLVGGQWVKGKRWPLELEIVYNEYHPEIPKTAEMIFPVPGAPTA